MLSTDGLRGFSGSAMSTSLPRVRELPLYSWLANGWMRLAEKAWKNGLNRKTGLNQ
jgi:hypothetical protein